jgi:hypothetical protein
MWDTQGTTSLLGDIAGSEVRVMSKPSPWEREIAWEFMSSLEKTVWAVTFALVRQPGADAVKAADEAVRKMQASMEQRSRRLEPEHEAVRAGFPIDRADFDVWYRISLLVRFGNEPGFVPPTEHESEAAYKRFQQGRGGVG